MAWIRFSGWLFVVLAIVTAAVMGVGSRLPLAQHATASGLVQAPPQQVWDKLTTVAEEPRWRSDVQAVEPAPAQGERTCWREQQGRFPVLLCAVVSDPPRQWTVRTMDASPPFGGTRSYTLDPGPGAQTRVSIVEDTTATPEMWRFVRRYLRRADEAPERTLAELQSSFPGERGEGGK